MEQEDEGTMLQELLSEKEHEEDYNDESSDADQKLTSPVMSTEKYNKKFKDGSLQLEDFQISSNSTCQRFKNLINVCDPRKQAHGYVIMLILCVARMGIVFCIDTPASLEGAIISVMRVDVTRYQLLNSLYSWPNVVVPVVGGILVDKVFGLRIGFLIFLSVACVGLSLVSLGAFVNWYWLMLVGRVIFGGGGQIAALCVDIFAASLFRKKELSFVFGLICGSGRIGSILNLNLTGQLYKALSFLKNRNARLGSVLLLAFGVCTVGLTLGIIASILDYRREKVLGTKREKQRGFKLKDIKDFSLSFWLLLIVGTLFFSLVFPFVGIAQLFFERKYGYTTDLANFVNALLFLTPIIATPLLGLLFDWTGYKMLCGIAGMTIALVCHLAFAFTGQVFFVPILAVLLIGLAYSIYVTAVWPQIFLIIQEHQFGTAYGVMNCGTQLGEAVVGIVTGVIADRLGYMFVELFFVILGCIALLLLLVLTVSSGGRALNISGKKRRMENRVKKADNCSEDEKRNL